MDVVAKMIKTKPIFFVLKQCTRIPRIPPGDCVSFRYLYGSRRRVKFTEGGTLNHMMYPDTQILRYEGMDY